VIYRIAYDGVSQPGELQSIATSPVRALETRYHWTGRRDYKGNFFGYEALARFERGQRPFYDVYFRTVP